MMDLYRWGVCKMQNYEGWASVTCRAAKSKPVNTCRNLNDFAVSIIVLRKCYFAAF